MHVITIHTKETFDPGYDNPHLEQNNTQLEKYAMEESEKHIKEHAVGATRIIKIQKRGYSPSEIILEYANKNNIDLIVMGTHGRRGLGYLFLGSVTEEVVRFAKCPVYTIREKKIAKPVQKINRIMVPIDFSDHSKKAITYAKILCRDYDAQLEVIHVIEESIPPALFALEKSSLLKLLPDLHKNSLKLIEKIVHDVPGPVIDTSIKVREGYVPKEILKHAEENSIDLIVMTTHGTSGGDYFLLGSVSEKVIRRAANPVFIVKSFGKQLF